MKKKFTTMTIEKLQKGIYTASLITGLLVGVLTLLLFLNIFVNKKTIWSSIATPLCLSPILFLNVSNIIAMKKELKSRKKS